MNAPLIEWSDQLVLGQDVMDDTHREFVVQLNRIGAATDDAMLAAIDEFIVHTESHFGEEERWMNEFAFPPRGCHGGEHEKVLETVREVRRRVEAGDYRIGRTLAEALAEWFPQHALSMDTVLAMYMKQIGYAPGADNSAVLANLEMPAGEGCHGAAELCSHGEAEKPAQ